MANNASETVSYYHFLQEELTASFYTQLAQLIHIAWPKYNGRGFTQVPPFHRIVAIDDPFMIAGQVSIVDLVPENPKAVLGISDLVVREADRKRHIGRTLLEEVTTYAEDHGAVLMAVVTRPGLASHLTEELGFHQSQVSEVYYSEDQKERWNETCYIRGVLPDIPTKIISDF